MKRSTRIATAALASAVVFGIAGPAAADRPAPGGPGQDQSGSHGSGSHGSVKGDKVEKEQRKVLRDIVAKKRLLAGAVKAQRVEGLAVTDRDAVRANVAAEQANLDALTETVKAATDVAALKEVRADLREIRVANYVQVINMLRRAGVLAPQITAMREDVEAGSVEETALSDAETALASAVAAAHAVTGTSTASDLRAIRAGLVEVQVALQAVKDSLADTTAEDDGTGDETGDDTGDDTTPDPQPEPEPQPEPQPEPGVDA